MASKRIAISGASGLVGRPLVRLLRGIGHRVSPLVRRRGRDPEDRIYWNPADGVLDPADLEGFYGVVHLAGEPVAARRWSRAQRGRIRDSRVRGTRLLCETLAKLEHQPEVLICASAIGFYGDRGAEPVDESSARGEGFLADVVSAWERETDVARKAGIRVVNLRIGVVLAADGGALAKMVPIFRKGVGGRLGSGRQFMSWVSLDDVTSVVDFALLRSELSGPVNVVSPNPVTNAEFTKTLASVLGRPAVIPTPAFALRMAVGKRMADEILLGGAQVVPKTLQQHGFEWSHPDLEGALRHVLVPQPG